MSSDEQEIRELVTNWLEATKAGDVERVLSMMSEDVVFLAAGQPLMRREDFAVAARAQSGEDAPKIDGESEVQEIKVLGEWAFMWLKLNVVITPASGKPMERAGYTLSILKKENGKWVLARDANMLSAGSAQGE